MGRPPPIILAMPKINVFIITERVLLKDHLHLRSLRLKLSGVSRLNRKSCWCQYVNPRVCCPAILSLWSQEPMRIVYEQFEQFRSRTPKPKYWDGTVISEQPDNSSNKTGKSVMKLKTFLFCLSNLGVVKRAMSTFVRWSCQIRRLQWELF